MRYYRTTREDGSRLLVSNGGTTADLTAVSDGLQSIADLALSAQLSGQSMQAITARLLEDAPEVDPATIAFDVPILAEEVWAAGVTYYISEQAREAESGMSEVYLKVFESERPELFLKATPSRTVGPNQPIGIRGDSEWDVPEPELGVVLCHGEIVGYTIGNDVSSRSIEGENPLYLPQAKMYDRSCAIGPCIVDADAISDPHDLAMSMRITRGGEEVYADQTSTSEMVRTCEELVSYLKRHNVIPSKAVLLTGTSLVPDEPFTLEEGDHVEITIEDIGTLENPVTVV